MTFIYSDTEDKPTHGFKGGKVNPIKGYLKHLENWFFLRHICIQGSTLDKFQATHELTICERKLDYHYRKPEFDPAQIEARLSELQTQWSLKYRANDYDETQRKWIRQKSWLTVKPI